MSCFFHEDTRRDWNFDFLINILFFCLFFWLSYSLLIYHSTCLTSTHLFSLDSCLLQSSSFVGAFLTWTGHECLTVEMMTLAKLCFKKTQNPKTKQLGERYQPVTSYYMGLDGGSYICPIKHFEIPFSSTAIASGKSCPIRDNTFSVQVNKVGKRGQKTWRGLFAACWSKALGSSGGIPGRCWADADCGSPMVQTLLDCSLGQHIEHFIGMTYSKAIDKPTPCTIWLGVA